MESWEMESSLERVQRMEQYLEEILVAFKTDDQSLQNEVLQEKLSALSLYYTGGLWLEDYDRDCAGVFPREMKRGVLAQDTLYNLFEELGQLGLTDQSEV